MNQKTGKGAGKNSDSKKHILPNGQNKLKTIVYKCS